VVEEDVAKVTGGEQEASEVVEKGREKEEQGVEA